jgi:hypothetical protein
MLSRMAVFCLSALLALCLLSSASSAQSRDAEKDSKGGDRKREEPKREEPKREDSSGRESSTDRAKDRRPVRERKERPRRESAEKNRREQPSRSDGSGKERSASKERESSRDRSSPDGSGSRDKRTVPDRSSSDGTSLPERRRPPRDTGDRDYERSRDGGSAGTRPVDPNIRPRRREPVIDGDTRKKDVPAPNDRKSIIVEGWPTLPPWYPRILWGYHEPLPSPKPDPYLIHLPFGTIRPTEVDDQFLILLNDLWQDGMQNALLVCIIQTYRAMEVDRFELFFDAEDEVTVYGSFTPNSFLALASVQTIYELLEDPRVRWVGEYRPYYKINDSVRLWEHDGVFVFPLEDDSTEFREDLEDLYLSPEFYDAELGFYFVPAEDYEMEAISEFWWVAEVLRVVSDPDLVYGYDYRRYD